MRPFSMTGMVVAHQTSGDIRRFQPHLHAIVLEGDFDNEGTLFYIPFSGLEAIVEVFRQRLVWLLGWKHSGFSIDNSVRILDLEAQTNPAEYISRPPIR